MTLQLYCPIAKIDRELREVYGYASTEATDSQGEIVRKEALEAALPAYMRFANIREMHQPSAVGVAKEAGIDDKGLWLKARIVDDEAWVKVREGVYKGFSIGGRVTGRDAAAPNIVTGVDLTEISLVDRPANPEAVFALWKAAQTSEAAALKAARARLAQKWQASDGASFVRAEDAARHEAGLGKASSFAESASPTSGLTHYALEGAADSDGPFADPGYLPDGKRRYPLADAAQIRAAWSYIHRAADRRPYTEQQLAEIEARIVAAWRAKIDPNGPPAAAAHVKAARGGDLAKGLQLAARLACLVEELQWFSELSAGEEAAESDAQSTLPDALQDAVAQLCAALRAMVDEETGELLEGAAEPSDEPIERAAASLPPAHAAALLSLVRGTRLATVGAGRLAAALAKLGARHSRADFAHIQRIHDECVALGAACGGAGGAAPAMKRADGALAKLEERLDATLPAILEVKALVEKIAAQPAIVPPARLVAVDKSADVARELERIAEQPPALTAFELIKRAVREPLPFGARLT